jgi:putative chitinase
LAKEIDVLTVEQLIKIMPYAKARAAKFIDGINAAMSEFDISTPARQAAFLAQIGHESGQLQYVKELASGDAYEHRKDLGNTWPGDGRRYKGRGLIQITGRFNMDECGKALGLDLLAHPELLEEPANACRSAGWFWATHGLNKWADAGDIDGVSDVINRGRKTVAVGDSNGWADRLALYKTALQVLA